MNFNFPNFIKVNQFGIDKIDERKPQNNIVNIDNQDYIFRKLSINGNKGGHSIILKIYSNTSNIHTLENYNDLDDIKPDAILKINKRKLKKRKGVNLYSNSHKRALNEIKALEICNENNSTNIIQIYNKGECKIDDDFYIYYTMEPADSDLKEFIEDKHSDLKFENKVKFCKEILEGIKELKKLNLYHRDIKPDNVFIINKVWKLGDLGLVDGRDLDYKIDEDADFIGPRGWVSPEVMNKHLTENKSFKIKFDCNIDHQSDIFQLGKLFWYIFQHNAPIGSVKSIDFSNEYSDVFPILKRMLNHNKLKRFNEIDEIIESFKRIELKLLKTL